MQTERLLTHLLVKCAFVRKLVGRLHELRFPTRSALQLADLIDRLTEAIEEEALRRYRTAGRPSEDFAQEVRFAVRAVESLVAHLRFVERATSSHNPWSIIRPLERLAEQLHPNARFIFRPQWHYNYTILEVVGLYRDAFSKWLSRLVPAGRVDDLLRLGGSTTKIYVVSFPYMERLNVFQHSILGHELGHPVADNYVRLEKEDDFMPAIFQAVRGVLGLPEQLEKSDIFKYVEMVTMTQAVRRLRERALTELLCDYVSLRVFGPIALFATEEYALPRELDQFVKDPESHYPPWRYRLREMVQELDPAKTEALLHNGGFAAKVAEPLRARIRAIQDLVADDKDRKEIEKDREGRIAYELVSSTLPKARRSVDAYLTSVGFSLDGKLESAGQRLFDRLAAWVPPDAWVDDRGDEVVANLHSILLIGWLRFLEGFSQIEERKLGAAERDPYLQDLGTLQRLVLKAVEYVELRASWARRGA